MVLGNDVGWDLGILGSWERMSFAPRWEGLGPVPGVSKNTRPDPFPGDFLRGEDVGD